MRTFPTVVVSTFAALVMNIVLDTYTDIQLLFRWVIAILVGLLVTICLSQWFKKRRGQDARSQATRSP